MLHGFSINVISSSMHGELTTGQFGQSYPDIFLPIDNLSGLPCYQSDSICISDWKNRDGWHSRDARAACVDSIIE